MRHAVRHSGAFTAHSPHIHGELAPRLGEHRRDGLPPRADAFTVSAHDDDY
jgi:hypothetical protein